jgi:acetolactate synthase-1/2/3 large subunit
LSDVLRAVDDGLEPHRTVVTDLGRSIFAAIRQIDIARPRGFVWTANFGSIGLGMSAAIGAYIGAPDSPVLLVCGDGGFMMGGLAEFTTAVHAGVDLVAVVCNDGAYGAEHVQFRDRQMDPSLATMAWPELSSVAVALGGQGLAVRGEEDVAAITAFVRDRSGPVLLDVLLDVDSVPNVNH